MMQRTTFDVPGMDCAAEERLVRRALAAVPDVRSVEADLTTRRLHVRHDGEPTAVADALDTLNFGARLHETFPDTGEVTGQPTPEEEAQTLRIVLAINGGMFIAEATGAVLADSSALLADSLDMLADAAVYGIALFGVHRAHASQIRAARISGLLQLALAIGALVEVTRRALFGSEPEAPLMLAVAGAALVANATSMWLLQRHRHGGAHMKASWIFTTNDVIANTGVIVAAGLVQIFASNLPDLIVGGAIGLVVARGAIRILNLRTTP